MSRQYISLENLKFLLYEVFNIEQLTKYEYYQDHSQEIFDMMLDSALQIGDQHMLPIHKEMDRNEPQLVDGKIRVHEKMRELMQIFGEGGWVSAMFDYEVGGQQVPILLNSATNFIFNAANYSASVFPFLGAGVAGLIRSFASKELQEIYLPPIFEGHWQGTMALTEPDAGSSLSDITTTAYPTDKEGVYNIQGQKIYISCGDHDAADNIIHLMLAKIKGAPVGVKGISLFIVPQKRITENGLESNDVTTMGVYHKMGYKGAPIAHLGMGEKEDCYGYLVGEEHKGLIYMFQMMNEARIGVGINAAAIASAAYSSSLEYAKERPQGRKIDNKDLTKAQIPIIEHADVKRMLLFQKATTEGALSLLLQASLYADLEKVSEGEEKEKYALLLDFLTPITKTYPSEAGIHSTSAAVQILGGAGYCTDFPIEQYYREARIHPIHEGTTGIHGLDLLGRKIAMKNGKAFLLLLEEISKTIEEAKTFVNTQKQAEELQNYLEDWKKVTQKLTALGMQNKVEEMMSDATLFLEMSGLIVVAWQWLKQGGIAEKALSSQENSGVLNDNLDTLTATETQTTSKQRVEFYEGKRFAMRYFFAYELPKVQYLNQRLNEEDFLTIEMQKELF